MIATTTPVIVTPSKAMNFINMSKSFTLVPSLVDTQLRNVTRNSPVNPTVLLYQGFMVSASAPIAARTTYSPMIMEIMAALPGFSTKTATHMNRKPQISPNILARYTCDPPLRGIAPPSSA